LEEGERNQKNEWVDGGPLIELLISSTSREYLEPEAGYQCYTNAKRSVDEFISRKKLY
jgi:hypothetical protein